MYFLNHREETTNSRKRQPSGIAEQNRRAEPSNLGIIGRPANHIRNVCVIIL